MRYIKMFVLVLVFFFVMMFFVQNQASFADPVTLRLDLLFMQPMESIPMPLYALMLICFAAGALLVLLMLLWDRVSASGHLAGARRRVRSLEKQLEAATADAAAEKEKLLADAAAEKAALEAALADAEKRLAEATQTAQPAAALDSLD